MNHDFQNNDINFFLAEYGPLRKDASVVMGTDRTQKTYAIFHFHNQCHGYPHQSMLQSQITFMKLKSQHWKMDYG